MGDTADAVGSGMRLDMVVGEKLPAQMRVVVPQGLAIPQPGDTNVARSAKPLPGGAN